MSLDCRPPSTLSSPASERCDELAKPDTIPKTKYACIMEAHGSTRQRLESSLPKDHEDHIAGKGPNSMTHYHLVHKSIPMPQAMKILDAKAAVDKEWKKLETTPAWQLQQVQKQQRCCSGSTKRQIPLCFTDGNLSSPKCVVRTNIPEVQRSSRAHRRHRQRRFWILCSIL